MEAAAIVNRVGKQLAKAADKLATTNPDVAKAMRAQSYEVFLSDPTSARTGGVYFCGLKPYGAKGRSYPAATVPPPGFMLYRDAPSSSPFYPRAKQVIRHALDLTLGKDAPLEAALATNWYFQRAADTAQLKQFGLERLDVSSIHGDLLTALQPRIILCAGNGPVSAYAGMLDLLGLKTTHQEKYLGNSYLRVAQWKGAPLVVGFPHLSRYPMEHQAEELITKYLS